MKHAAILLVLVISCVPATAQDDACADLRAGGGPALRAMVEIAQYLHQAAQVMADAADDPAVLEPAAVMLFKARIAASAAQQVIGPEMYRLVRGVHERVRDFDPATDSPASAADAVRAVRDRVHERVMACFGEAVSITPYTAQWVRETASLAGCGDVMRAVAFGDGGRVLAGGDTGGCVTLWDTTTWQVVGRLEHPGGVERLAFTPDGTLLASGGAGGDIRLWEVDGDLRSAWAGHAGRVIGLGFDAAGAALISAGADGRLLVWSAAGGQITRSIEIDGLTAAAVRGEVVAAGDFGGALHLWDLASGAELAAPGAHESAIFSLALDPQRALLAAGDFDGVRLWQTGGDAPGKLDGRASLAVSMAFSPAGDVLAVGTASAVMLGFPAAPASKGQPVNLYGHGEVVTDVAFNPDGVLLASAGGEGRARVWRVPPLDRLITQAEVVCMLVAPDYVNAREGPGTDFAVTRVLQPGARIRADAQTVGEDGLTWWRLTERGYWVRADVVEEAGDCDQLPAVE
ncbi:MAG: hypothetical protein JXB47_01255 [Anaerolineae bacterium]|nr:hypothetical protein [Anaerolineae bacterium]